MSGALNENGDIMRPDNAIEEVWKVIDGYSLYMISSTGRVKRCDTGKILSGGLDKDGYRQVTLQTETGQVCKRISRLVAAAFVNNELNLPFINHIDENKQNDNFTNLEWCTARYNNTYGSRLNNISRKVRNIELDKVYKSTRDAERDLDIPHSYISRCCRGLNDTAGGFHWEFYDFDAINYEGDRV